jgi:hypothetical protein
MIIGLVLVCRYIGGQVVMYKYVRMCLLGIRKHAYLLFYFAIHFFFNMCIATKILLYLQPNWDMYLFKQLYSNYMAEFKMVYQWGYSLLPELFFLH